MTFLVERFPDTVAMTGGPSFQTEVAQLLSGVEYRNTDRSRSKHKYSVSSDNRDAAVARTLDSFFRKARGRLHSFRFKDWADFQLLVADSSLAELTPLTHQLSKVYGADEAALKEVRALEKPITGTVLLYRNAVLLTAGGGAGNYAIDLNTGIITFVSRAARTVASWGSVGATQNVTLSSSIGGLAIGDQLTFSGVGGTAAALFNGLRVNVTVVSGAPTYTLAVNTTGLTVTGTGGVAVNWIYGGSNDAMTGACDFDVPVRFDFDEKRTDLVFRDADGSMVVNWNNIALVEVFDE